jgi:hypothetical protein
VRSWMKWGSLVLLAGACRAEPEAPAAEACASNTPPCGVEAPIEVPPYTGTHPIDAATHAPFFLAGHVPVEDDRPSLCRRLFADLVGRYPTRDEVVETCGDRSAEAIVDDLMARDAHLHLAQRQWRDRLDTLDVLVRFSYLKSLYEEVDQLTRGELLYPAFVERVLAHPGFVGQDFFPAERAARAFDAFLGRPATESEANDFGNLFRPWVLNQESDPDFPYIAYNQPYVWPAYCEPFAPCSTTLFGGASLGLTGTFEDYATWETIDETTRQALFVPGRLLAKQPLFWEAAADDILERYLGWNDGGRFPREVGIVLPEVRRALTRFLEQTGNWRQAERLVLTSWLYRQRTVFEPGELPADAPVWMTGPVKAADAETWLDSAMNVTIDFGNCDPRYPDGFGYSAIQQILANDPNVDPSTIAAEFVKLHELSGSRLPLVYAPDYQGLIPSFQYYGVARIIGGCPGFNSGRVDPVGTSFAYTQESLAELLCQEGVVDEGRPFIPGTTATLHHQMSLLFGREARAEEIAGFHAAHDACVPGEDCDSATTISSVCVALLGSAEMLFY